MTLTRKSLLPTIFQDNDLGSLLQHSFGMDQLLHDVFDDFLPSVSTVNFPQYNIREDDERTRVLEMALAGYGENDIDVTVEGNNLVISGNKVTQIDDNQTKYIHKGLAARKFERRFLLTETQEVTDATLSDGMLKITVVSKEPLNEEPKRITINSDPTKT